MCSYDADCIYTQGMAMHGLHSIMTIRSGSQFGDPSFVSMSRTSSSQFIHRRQSGSGQLLEQERFCPIKFSDYQICSPDEKGALQNKRGHIGQGSKSRQNGPHVQQGRHIDEVGGLVVIADAPIQRHHQDAHSELVKDSWPDELGICEIPAHSILHHSPQKSGCPVRSATCWIRIKHFRQGRHQRSPTRLGGD